MNIDKFTGIIIDSKSGKLEGFSAVITGYLPSGVLDSKSFRDFVFNKFWIYKNKDYELQSRMGTYIFQNENFKLIMPESNLHFIYDNGLSFEDALIVKIRGYLIGHYLINPEMPLDVTVYRNGTVFANKNNDALFEGFKFSFALKMSENFSKNCTTCQIGLKGVNDIMTLFEESMFVNSNNYVIHNDRFEIQNEKVLYSLKLSEIKFHEFPFDITFDVLVDYLVETFRDFFILANIQTVVFEQQGGQIVKFKNFG